MAALVARLSASDNSSIEMRVLNAMLSSRDSKRSLKNHVIPGAAQRGAVRR